MTDSSSHIWVSRKELPPEVTCKLYHGVMWLLVTRVWYFAMCKKSEPNAEIKEIETISV